MNGIEYNARLEEWQFFVTLTFSNPIPSEAVRLKMLFAWLRALAESAKVEKGGQSQRLAPVHFSRLLWVARSELGEGTGRVHFHLLLSGLDIKRVNRTECFWQQDAWEKLGGGIARIRTYSAVLDGVGYVLKGLSEASKAGANDYELSKFVDQSGTLLITSHSALGKWGAAVRRGMGCRAHGIAKSRTCDTTARRGSSRELSKLTTSFGTSKALQRPAWMRADKSSPYVLSKSNKL